MPNECHSHILQFLPSHGVQFGYSIACFCHAVSWQIFNHCASSISQVTHPVFILFVFIITDELNLILEDEKHEWLYNFKLVGYSCKTIMEKCGWGFLRNKVWLVLKVVITVPSVLIHYGLCIFCLLIAYLGW